MRIRGRGFAGVRHETGIVDEFPDSGLKVKWLAPIRSGFSGPAVADGRVFVTDWVEDPESRTIDGIERVLALDERTGARQLIIWHPAGLASLDPETGEAYWEEPWEVGVSMNVITPLKIDNYLLVSQFYNGSLMMQFGTDRPTARLMWKGLSRSEMTPQARWGGAFIVQHGDRYFVNNDNGDLIIAQFTPTGYVEIDRTKLLAATTSAGYGPRKRHDRMVNWAHPAYANRHIVHRNVEELLRASLAVEDY